MTKDEAHLFILRENKGLVNPKEIVPILP